MKIDLNCDLGEGFGIHDFGFDADIMKYISSANIACGFHAGDYMTMAKTVELAIRNNVKIGAHPGFPDLQGFGRRNMNLSLEEIQNLVTYQVGSLDGFVRSSNAKLNHVKPHGALYNLAAENQDVANAIAKAIVNYNSDLFLYGLAGSKMEESAKKFGLNFKSEVFADRAYLDNGKLVPRTMKGAFVHGAKNCALRIESMIKEQVVQSITGKWIPINAQTICVHGDNSEALQFVKTLAQELRGNGYEIG